MGCCGGRKDDTGPVSREQQWDYINLNDFKSTTCFTPLSYGILWISLLISVAVYGVDTFTAINLLAFSRWASQIKPKIPLYISKWVFAGCILLSFALLAYRWLRAIRVMRSGGVAQSYLDPLAVRVQSIRMGERGRGWKRFLVFAELTKSKKGADYIALFTYFSFEAWLRVVFAEGPRQVINAVTLYSVLQLNLIPQGENAAPEGTSAIHQFFINLEALADKDKQQAVILSAMLFTLVIWVFSVIGLILSLLFYLFFLFHHIPSEDGSLSNYCRRKINTRLERIVKQKVDKALAKGVMLQDRKPADPEAAMGSSFKRQPTLPTFDNPSNDTLPTMPGLSRQPTGSTLPLYTSRPGTAGGDLKRQPTLPEFDDEVMMGGVPHSRTSDDDAPLMSNAGEFAYSQNARYQPGPPRIPPIDRQGTPLSLMSGPRPPTAQDRRTPGPSPTPGPQAPGQAFPFPPQPPPSSMGRRTPVNPPPGRSLTPGMGNGYSSPRPTPPPGSNNGFQPYQPGMSGPPPRMPSPNATPGPAPFRNFARPSTTSPSNEFARPPLNRPPPQRQGTAPLPQRGPSPYNQF